MNTAVAQLKTADQVLVEAWTDPQRLIMPDIQIVSANDAPALFVEVRVASGMSENKVRLVRESRVPLVKVDGLVALGLEYPTTVLPSVAALNVPAPSQCSRCDARDQEAVAARAQAEKEAARQRAHEAQLVAAMPEAAERAREYFVASPRTKMIAHSASTSVPLQVWATWFGETVTLELVIRTGPPICRWTGTPEEMTRVLFDELHEQALRHLMARSAPVPANAHFELCEQARSADTGARNLPPPPPEQDPRWTEVVHWMAKRLVSSKREEPSGH